jgi:fatty acid desaturase
VKEVPISSERLRELSRLGPFGCGGEIAASWFSIVAIAWLSQRFWNPALYFLAVMWIGGRQHALGTFTHDAAHWRLFNHRKLNDFIAEFFCAWPIFIRMEAYRFQHLTHHKHVGTPEDPEYTKDRYPKSRKEIIVTLIRDVTGLNTFKQLADARNLDKAPVTRLTQALRVFYYLSIFGLITYLGAWKIFILYWLVPILTWLKAIVRIRSISDHAGLGAAPIDSIYPTRTTIPNLFEKYFVFPRSVSYHTSHHIYMSVPSKNLIKLHESLFENADYRSQSRVTEGVFGLLSEFPWEEKKSPTRSSRVRSAVSISGLKGSRTSGSGVHTIRTGTKIQNEKRATQHR